jgi:hypothetical protein
MNSSIDFLKLTFISDGSIGRKSYMPIGRIYLALLGNG